MNLENPRVFNNIQAARALAALTVVAYHLGVAPFGQCGVDVFFVISGFIMAYVAPFEGRNFLRKRIIRIVPLYWLSTIGIYAIATAKPHWLNSTTANGEFLLKSLLFIPYLKENGHWGPLNLNGWTLEYEVLFYIVIAVSMIFVNPRYASVVSATILAIYSILSACFGFSNPIVNYLGQPLLLEFCMGIAVYWFLRSVHTTSVVPRLWMTLALMSVGWIPVYFFFYGAPVGFARAAAYGLPSSLFVASVIAMENAGKVLRSRLFLRLGEASYAMYLLHPYVVGVLKKLLLIEPELTSLRGVFATVVAMIAVCIAGDGCHRLVEKPMLGCLNRWFKGARRGGMHSI